MRSSEKRVFQLHFLGHVLIRMRAACRLTAIARLSPAAFAPHRPNLPRFSTHSSRNVVRYIFVLHAAPSPLLLSSQVFLHHQPPARPATHALLSESLAMSSSCSAFTLSSDSYSACRRSISACFSSRSATISAFFLLRISACADTWFLFPTARSFSASVLAACATPSSRSTSWAWTRGRIQSRVGLWRWMKSVVG